jgi:hypothetical protein
MNPGAIPLMQAIQAMREHEQDRQMYLQDREAQKQAQERQRQIEDFKMQMDLQNAGGIPQTDVLRRFTSILGSPSSHNLMQTPIGPEYMPTQATRQKQALDLYSQEENAKASAAARAKLAEKQAERADWKEITIPAVGDNPATTIKVAPEHVASTLKTLADMKKRNIVGITKVEDADGNVSLAGIDTNTNQTVEFPLQAKGKGKTASEKALNSSEEKNIEDEAYNAAKGRFEQLYPQGQKNPNYRLFGNEPQFIPMEKSAEFKALLKDEQATRRKAALQNRRGGQAAGGAAPKAAAKPIPRATVEKYAQKRGITYEQAARQAQAEGYQIQQ